jgi:hypothetical protein
VWPVCGYIMIIYDDWIKSKATFADDTKVL